MKLAIPCLVETLVVRATVESISYETLASTLWAILSVIGQDSSRMECMLNEQFPSLLVELLATDNLMVLMPVLKLIERFGVGKHG